MSIDGFLDGHPVKILYDYDGLRYLDIFIKIGEVVFDWDELSPLQQEQVDKQLKRAPIDYTNYN